MTTTADAFATYMAAARQGIAVLAGVHGKTASQLAPQFTRAHAIRLIAAARTFHGPTTFTKKQKQARDAAMAQRHTVDTLMLIHELALKAPKATDQWNIRIELAGLRANEQALRKRGAELLKKLVEPASKPQALYTKPVDAHGMTGFHLHWDTLHHQQLMASIEPYRDSSLPEVEATAQAFIKWMQEGGNTAAPAYVVNVIVPIDKHVKAMSGTQGDGFMVACDDGTMITDQQYMQIIADADLNGVLVSKYHGALNAFRLERHANGKQRLLLTCETPVCARPGCSRPARKCRAHHIKAYKNGGETNLHNMTLLCDYHNGTNDDDPDRKLNGRIERINGHPAFIPPYPGAKPILNQHPLAQLGALRIFE